MKVCPRKANWLLVVIAIVETQLIECFLTTLGLNMRECTQVIARDVPQFLGFRRHAPVATRPDADGDAPTPESPGGQRRVWPDRIKELDREVREPRKTNEFLKLASA
jgi:hypothetical protein